MSLSLRHFSERSYSFTALITRIEACFFAPIAAEPGDMNSEISNSQSAEAPIAIHLRPTPDVDAISAVSNGDALDRNISNVSPSYSNSIDAQPKKHPSVHSRQISAISSDTQQALKFESPPIPSRPVDWKPSLVHFGPLAGLIALLLASLQILASFAVLWGSHNVSRCMSESFSS